MRVGAQPVGLRGDPLHTLQSQIRAVVRRRLGERHHHLLAEPQPYAQSGQVDWYCVLPGEIVPLSRLPEPQRGQLRAEIDAMLADIDKLGEMLEGGRTEDIRLAGGFLRLAARTPADDCCYRVGDQAVVVGWGYEVKTVIAAALAQAAVTTPAPAERPPAPAAAPVLPPAFPPAPLVLSRAPFPWLAGLMASMAAIVIVLLAAWMLRQFVPVAPDLRITELPAPPPVPIPVVHDPTPALRGALEALRTEQGHLRATLASLREELSSKLRQCKPPDLPEDRWKKRDLAVLEGCWVLGREVGAAKRRHGMPDVHGVTTAAKLCFSRDGRGTYEVSNRFPDSGEERCSGPVTASFESDSVVRIKYGDLPCRLTNGASAGNWLADTQTCRRLDDSQAQCTSGLTRARSEFRRDSTRR